MSVAAIFVNYHDAHGIAQAVRSVQMDAPDASLIVVDNSADEAQWQLLLRALPGGAKAVRSPSNIGFGRGCNLAVQHTDAPYVMLVNPDVRLHQGCTLALAQALNDQPELAAVSPRQFLDDSCEWMLPPAWLPTALRMWATEKVLRSPGRQPGWWRALRSENIRCWTASAPVRQRALSGGVLMIRRSSLPRGEPLFDPRFFMYFEDSDLCIRLRRGGWGLALIPQARATHAWRNAPHKGALMEQGLKTFVAKHYGPDDPWLRRKERVCANSPAPAWFTEALPLPQSTIQIPGKPIGLESNNTPWCVEVSPHAHLWPAVGRTGRGTSKIDLQPVINALASGPQVWVRLSWPDDNNVAHSRYWRYSQTH